MALDQIRRPNETIRPLLDNTQVQEALDRGDINEVMRSLPAGVTKDEVLDYLKSQHRLYQEQILQEYEIKAAEGTVPPPTVGDFNDYNPQYQMAPGDDEALFAGFGGKAVMTGKFGEDGADPGPGGDPSASPPPVDPMVDDVKKFGGDILALAKEHLKDYEGFADMVGDKIFELQLNLEMASKNNELKKFARRLVALVKSGQADPIAVILGLAKIKVERNGLHFVHLGRRMYRANMKSRMATDLVKEGSATGNLGIMEEGRQLQRGLGTDMTMLTSTMQKVVQDIQGTIGFAKGAIEEIRQGQRQLISKISLDN